MSEIPAFQRRIYGRKVLVIGGSAGIGYGVAEACLQNGCRVIISSSNSDRVQQAVAKLASENASTKDNITGYACDLGNEERLEANIEQLLQQAGDCLDHVVHTSGDKLFVSELAEMNMANVKQAGMVRFFAPIFIGKYAPKYMNPGPESSIIFTAGAILKCPNPKWIVPGAYFHGLCGIMRGMALDLQPIRVNLVSPGAVDTDLWADFNEQQKAAFFEQIGNKTSVGRVATKQDLAECYIYLMRDFNTTGEVVASDGGYFLKH